MPRPLRIETPVSIPPGHRTSLIFVDESGVANNGRFFVVGAVKVRFPGEFGRAIRAIRERHGFDGEFKFNRITRGRLPMYFDLADEIARHRTVEFAACIVDHARSDPRAAGRSAWEQHAQVVAQLLVGCIKKHELTSVCLDVISTPPDVAIEDEIRQRVNRRLGNLSVVTAVCLDSRCTDGLQVADLFAVNGH